MNTHTECLECPDCPDTTLNTEIDGWDGVTVGAAIVIAFILGLALG